MPQFISAQRGVSGRFLRVIRIHASFRYIPRQEVPVVRYAAPGTPRHGPRPADSTARPGGLLEPCAATSGKHGLRRWCRKRRSLSDNQVHLVCDVTLREDSSKVRTPRPRHPPQPPYRVLTGLCRQAGRNDIAAIRETELNNDLLTAITRLIPDL